MIYLWMYVSFFLLTPNFLFSTEVNLPTQKDVTEALKVIGKFLKDDGGPSWLASLVTKQSSPLRTEDLMKEILNATNANDSVKQAANTIKLALDEQNQHGTNQTLVLEFEGWKDIIDNIEEQEDIICLYRRSYYASSERSEDWQKFLKSISPEYTIYLALDMGQKYVICLKKIHVPDRNITSRNSDDANSTNNTNNTTLMDSSTTITSSSTEEIQISNSSRSMSHNDSPSKIDIDKCDSSEPQVEYDNTRNNPQEYSRRTIPMSNSPCSRPIFLMLPPTYMPPMVDGYNTPVWTRNGYQMGPNSPRAPQYLPYYYQQNSVPIARANIPPTYSNRNDKYKQMFDYGRKKLPPPSPSVEDKSRIDLNKYFRSFDETNRVQQPPRNIPFQPVHRQGYPYGVQPYFPPMWQSWPPLPYQPPAPYFGQGNYRYPSLMPPQIGPTRSPPYRSSPVSSTPAPFPYSHQPNCMSCATPCDRPILLKVLVENPFYQPVKVGFMPGREMGIGRRRMSEGLQEIELGNFNEKNEETTVGNGDKEIG